MATRTMEHIKDPREESMSAQAIGVPPVMRPPEEVMAAADEQPEFPGAQHKEGRLARLWKRIVDSYAAQYDGSVYPFS